MTAVRSRSARRSPAATQPKSTPRRTSAAASSTKSRAVVRIFPRRVVSLRLFVFMAVLLFFGFLFGAVAIQSQRISGQRQIDLLSAEIGAQQDTNHALRAQVAEREAPERITAEAEKLNMMEPGPVVPLTPYVTASGAAALLPEAASDPAGMADR